VLATTRRKKYEAKNAPEEHHLGDDEEQDPEGLAIYP